MPERQAPVGWYRFEAPPGTRVIYMNLEAESVQAWVDGRDVEVVDGRIELEALTEGLTPVALRIVQKHGVYAGAAIPEPVKFECESTKVTLGDWCDLGLESYSGGAVYGKTFELTPEHLMNKAFVDLGKVNASAELAVNGHTVGVRLARPYRFDVSDYVRQGVNRIEVTVFNTRANHYSGWPGKISWTGPRHHSPLR